MFLELRLKDHQQPKASQMEGARTGAQRAFRLLLIQRAAVLPIRDRSASILCMYPKQKQKWFAVQQSQQ